MKRTKEQFDFGWKFHKGDVKDGCQIDFDDSLWRVLNLPHDWSIEGPFEKDSESGQSLAYLPGGIGWYRKAFMLMPEDKEKRIFIDFDGVYHYSDVWINGHYLGLFPDGYTSFQYELTDYLVFDTENVISVRVDNSKQPNSRWYSGSGIYRHTWLTKTAPVYIVKDTTYITSPTAKVDESSISILSIIKNENKKTGAFLLNVEILDSEGIKIAEKWDAKYINPGESEQFSIIFWIKNVVLWDIENSYLYTACFKVYEGDETIEEKLLDNNDIQFGIRSIEFHKDNGLFLNGRQIKIQGVALHHEAGLLGAAVPDRVWERRLQKLKEMGCNSVRNAHSAASPEFMDMCDKLGLMVFDEMFDEWIINGDKNYGKTNFGTSRVRDSRYGTGQYFDEWGYKNIASTIRRDRNHPSVIIWGIGNEIIEQYENYGYLIARKLVEICHIEDPTRPTMCGNDAIHSEIPNRKAKPEFLNATDLIGINHIRAWSTYYRRLYSDDKLENPDWKIIGSEDSGLDCYRGNYSLESNPESMVKPYYMTMLDAEELWKFTKLYDYVIGDFLWTGIDYLGEWPWPYISSSAGLLDTCGFEKDGYYFYASQWSEKPIIKLAPHWNWQGNEGTAIPVICYTNCEEVELFVNGQSYGKQSYDFFHLGFKKGFDWTIKPHNVTTNALHLMWMVPYQQGQLRVVGKKNNQVYEDVVYTCSSAANIELFADRIEIKADEKDICHVEAKLLDANGKFACLSNDNLKFSLDGAGEILCLNSGNPTSHEIGMYADSICAFNGRCIAYIKAKKPGNIKLIVSGEGICTQSVTIKAYDRL